MVESKILGRNAIGVDINPLACLVTKVKTTNIKTSQLKEISEISISIKKDIVDLRGNATLLNFEDRRIEIEECIESLHPNISKWFHQNVIRELFVIKHKIDSLENKDTKDFLLVAFSSILRSVSNTTSGFGNLMINKQAPQKKRIYEKFAARVNDMIKAMSGFNEIVTDSNIKIFNQDTRNLGFIGDEEVDFICTHPPYMASCSIRRISKIIFMVVRL